MKALAAKGLVEKWLGDSADPLGFLIHEGGAANMIEAAYRFARHEPGVDVVLFGTGDAEHLRTQRGVAAQAAAAGGGPGEARGAVRAPDGRRRARFAPGGRQGGVTALLRAGISPQAARLSPGPGASSAATSASMRLRPRRLA